MLLSVVQIVVVLTLVIMAVRSVRDRSRRPEALQALARELQGRVIPSADRGTRPQIEGTFEGSAVRLSFPVRWTTNLDQELRATFEVKAARAIRIRRRSALGDLTSLGVSATPDLASRVDYVFSTLRGSDLVVQDGVASMSVRWPWTANGLQPRRIMLPIAEVHALVQLLDRSR